MKSKAIFLDRDGVLNEEKNNLFKKEDIQIIGGVKELLKKLKEKGYLLLVVTNQPVIARGLATPKEIEEINQEINLKLDNIIDKFYFCPHHPDADLEKYRKSCDCRKPLPGMIMQGIKEFDIDVTQSYMVGDRISDIIAGKKAGCKTILLKKEHSHNKIVGKGFEEINPDYTCKNFFQAYQYITKIKAIILCAGKGTRIKEVNSEVPKILIKVLGKPMLKWNIDLLQKYGINEIAINTSYMADKIKNYLQTTKGDFKISYEPELLGTSGALNNFRDFFENTFIVIYGDIISQINLDKLLEFHKEKKGVATLVIHESSHPEDSDIVQIDENKKVIKLLHKPGNREFGTLGNAALYVVEPIIFKYLPEGKSDFIKDIFATMVEKGEKIYGYETNEFIKDAGTPERLNEIQQYLKKRENKENNDNL